MTQLPTTSTSASFPSLHQTSELVRGSLREAFVQRLEQDFRRIGDQVIAIVGPNLVALLLVGSYARDEGGMVVVDGRPGPYNDYDFVVVVKGTAQPWHRKLWQLGRNLTAELGIDVDLWPVGNANLDRRPPTLFWLDVSMGGVRVIAGDSSIVQRLRGLSPRRVPLDEVARQLANRAAGIALSNLEGFESDPLRAMRHAHKAVLACGDSVLLATDRYSATRAERCNELKRMGGTTPNIRALAEAYQEACVFRAAPSDWRVRYGSPRAWFASTVEEIGRFHLAFENRRVGAPTSPLGYASFASRLFGRSEVLDTMSLCGSMLRSTRLGFPVLPFVGHLRERLARVAVLLAYAPEGSDSRYLGAALLGIPRASVRESNLFRQEAHAKLKTLASQGG